MNKSNIVSAAIIIVLLFVVGCGSDSDKAQGVWKDTRGKDLIHTHFVEIGKDYVVIDGKREDGLVLVDIDDAVMVQTAGSRKDVMRLVLHDDDTLTIEIPLLGKQKLVRSSKEEIAAKEKLVAEAREVAFKKAESERIAKEKKAEEERIIKEKKIADLCGIWKESGSDNLLSTKFFEIGKDFLVIEDTRIDGIELVVNADDNEVFIKQLGREMYIGDKGFYAQLEGSNTLILDLPRHGKVKLIKTSYSEKEDRDRALSERYNTLIGKSYGTWVRDIDENKYRSPMDYQYNPIVITKDSLTYDNKSKSILFSRYSEVAGKSMPYLPAIGYADNSKEYTFCITSFDDNNNTMNTVTTNWKKRKAKYARIDPANIRLHDNPSIDYIKGGWAKEGDSKDGYNVIAFSKELLYCDGHSMKVIDKADNKSPQLSIRRAGDKDECLMDIVQFDPDTIKVMYNEGNIWHTYKRMSSSDAKKAMSNYSDKIKLLQGYWKSESPVDDGDLPPLVIPPKNIQYYFYSGKDEVA